jgi:hypothetical protein
MEISSVVFTFEGYLDAKGALPVSQHLKLHGQLRKVGLMGSENVQVGSGT